MTATCDECGDPLGDADKNAAGHFRDRCAGCIDAAAAGRDRHVDTCEDVACAVCASYREEGRR